MIIYGGIIWEKNTVEGKASSKRWKREATLRDIVDALDEITASDMHPEKKAKLRQRVIDYRQFLSQEIYCGRRSVPESDDNETIKEFNLRMVHTYYTNKTTDWAIRFEDALEVTKNGKTTFDNSTSKVDKAEYGGIVKSAFDKSGRNY